MTLEEKVICETYTGICFTSSEERSEVYKYAEKLMGRPVYTHEFPRLADQLKEHSRADFIRVCKGEFATVRYGKWEAVNDHYSQMKCSLCGVALDLLPLFFDREEYFLKTAKDMPYCFRCGAKMEVDPK